MSERILGPAYPALLAPGLRVFIDGDDNAGTVLRDEPDGDVRVAWDDWLSQHRHGFGLAHSLRAVADAVWGGK